MNKDDKQMIATVAGLVEAINEIKVNHLPHLQTELNNIRSMISSGGWTIASILLGILVTLIFKK